MQTTLYPQYLSDKERIEEAASIMANGLLRWQAAHTESDFPLDSCPPKSVHADRYHHGENSNEP